MTFNDPDQLLESFWPMHSGATFYISALTIVQLLQPLQSDVELL